MISIKPISRDLSDAWARMRVALWPDESPEQLRHDVSKFFESGLPHVRAVLVALDEGQPIGFAELNIRSCAEGCETDRG